MPTWTMVLKITGLVGADVSVFYFCVNRKLYHKFCSSKQHTHVLPHSCCESGVWAWCSWILCSVVQDFNQGVRQAVFSSGGLVGKESASKPIQAEFTFLWLPAGSGTPSSISAVLVLQLQFAAMWFSP